MDIDDIAIMTPEDYATYMANKSAGISEIAGEFSADAKVVGVYNLNGVRVADSERALGDARGIYIVRTTEGVKKLIR